MRPTEGCFSFSAISASIAPTGEPRRQTALALLILALPAQADDLASNLARVHGSDGMVARLIEAHRLADLGQAAHDPVLLFAAAGLIQGVTLRQVARRLADPVAAPAPEPKPDKTKKPQKTAPSKEPAADVPAITVVADPARSTALPGSLDPQALKEAARVMLPDGDILRRHPAGCDCGCGNRNSATRPGGAGHRA